MDILEFNRFNWTKQFNSIIVVDDGWFQINGCENTTSCCFTTLQLIDKDTKDEHRHRHSSADKEEGDQLSSRDFSFFCQPSTSGDKKAKCNSSNDVNHRDESVTILTRTHGLVTVGSRFSIDAFGLPLLSVVGLNDGYS